MTPEEMIEKEVLIKTMDLKELLIKMDAKIDRIQHTTTQTNGKVIKHEQKLENQETRIRDLQEESRSHITNCPNIKDIRMLQDNQLAMTTVKKFLIKAVILVGGLLTIIQVGLNMVI